MYDRLEQRRWLLLLTGVAVNVVAFWVSLIATIAGYLLKFDDAYLFFIVINGFALVVLLGFIVMSYYTRHKQRQINEQRWAVARIRRGRYKLIVFIAAGMIALCVSFWNTLSYPAIIFSLSAFVVAGYVAIATEKLRYLVEMSEEK